MTVGALRSLTPAPRASGCLAPCRCGQVPKTSADLSYENDLIASSEAPMTMARNKGDASR